MLVCGPPLKYVPFFKVQPFGGPDQRVPAAGAADWREHDQPEGRVSVLRIQLPVRPQVRLPQRGRDLQQPAEPNLGRNRQLLREDTAAAVCG